MGKCSIKDCNRETLDNETNCILHCKKNGYQEDRFRIGFLEMFYKELIDYITDYIFINKKVASNTTKVQIREFLNNTQYDWNLIVGSSSILIPVNVILKDIVFPGHDSRDFFDFAETIDKLGGVHFDNCEFYCDELEVMNAKLFFQDCTFHKEWFLFNNKVLENSRNVLYQRCNFLGNIHAMSEDPGLHKLESPIFSDCSFSESIILDNLKIQATLFNDTVSRNQSIKKISIVNCLFEDKFTLNSYSITEFICNDSDFDNLFELKNSQIKIFEINYTNFHRLFDCFGTHFIKFEVSNIAYDDFVGFEKCKFGDNDNNTKNNAIFNYATFMRFANFKYARFINGLDLQHININGSINFLHASVSPDNTNRETFRIIKHSFDAIENFIEANKYYEKEMLKYKEELRIKNLFQYCLLSLYKITSNFGQSFIKPIIFIVVASIIYGLLICGYNNNSLYKIYPPLNCYFSIISNLFNSISKNILPFNKVLKEGMEFISMIFYILFTSLIWLVILAIKRTTKR